ncbi:hypothetical protein HII31_09995 [Pseudocercospora fuligena]|uniref:RRM domain-containing protein n=1 Tax=Pseudocercospora fuligena TaxID=685502 RepID=A0A8H6VDW9_9PEZI|nr:hypothetical protein HII31_09995 [Pseudocercospora fuligena]
MKSLRSQASDISFHSIETFPEKGFGYVELPAMEAQKLKKKLNGTVLKGSWVNEDGRTVEAEPPNKKRRRERDTATESSKKEKKSKKSTPEPVTDSIVEEAPALDSTPEDSKIELAHASLSTREEWSGDEDSVSSSSVSSESSPSPSSSEDEAESEAANSDAELNAQLARAKFNTVSNKNTPAPDATSGAEASQPVGEPKEVHPLEALFKRPSQDTEKPKPAPIDTSFSFFNPDDNEEDVAVEIKVPQTPRTKEELEWRSIRSAAPTPDTAALGKSFDFSFTEDQDEDMRDVPESPVRAKTNDKAEGEKEESEFRKWFYENRGDLNRAWKKRRREERKVGRQRENRRLRR